MNRAILLVLVLAGCKSELNPAYCAAHPTDTRCVQAGDGGVIDGDDFDGNDAVAPAICLGTDPFKVCLREMPTTDTSVTVGINTGNSGLCLKPADTPIDWAAQNEPDACFIVGANVTLTGNLAVRGPRPLVLVATGTVTLTGQFDLAAHRNQFNTNQTPPGFNAAACDPVVTPAKADPNGASGGGGGSLGTKGGNGGTGDNGTVAAGLAVDQTFPTVLHGGCPGAPGGLGDGQGTAGMTSTGGWGGGVLYVLAQTSIVLTDGTIINASGAAGMAGNDRTGGGGGGSGGMIVLTAPLITAGSSTFVMANGGGGAAGGTNASDGKNGTDPANGNPSMPAPGGTQGALAAGGNGYAFNGVAIDATTGAVGTSGNGGGGGGGGAGLFVATMSLGATAGVSPPPQ